MEHAILHLIYSRFWTKVMRDLGLVKNDEPVERLFTQGMVIKNGAKMSKSKGNVVSPDEMIERFGADATRMYALFAAPPDRDLDWQEDGVAGVSRFLGRVYRFAMQHAASARRRAARLRAHRCRLEAQALLRKLHQTIRKDHRRLCGAVAFQYLHRGDYGAGERADGRGGGDRGGKGSGCGAWRRLLRTLTLLLAPFAPYLAFELWEHLAEKGDLLRAPWPKFDEALAREEQIEIPVQINGKLRAVVTVDADADEEALKAAALVDEKIAALLAGKEVVRIIVVPRKLINIVVK